MSERVSIIGDGAMATLCAAMLAENGLAVRLFSIFPEAAAELNRTRTTRALPEIALPPSVEITTDAAAAFDGSAMAVSAVASQFTRMWWERLAAHCPVDLPVCSVTKGNENKKLLRPTQHVQDVIDSGRGTARDMAALSGPCIAPEVARRLPATVTAASTSGPLAQRVQRAFGCPYFRVYTNTDMIGTELAGATKNVIAIAAGILDGLGAGDNAKAALLTRGLVEITRLGLAMGARPETFAGLAGMGDLVTTCISPVGRNRSFGEAVGRGKTVAEAQAAAKSVVEGVATTVSVVELAARHNVEMPITQGVHDVLFNNVPPAAAIASLMSRPLKRES